MPRIPAVNLESATGKTKEVLEGVKASKGMMPNIVATMANSPAVAEAYLGISGALAGGALDAKTREAIALRVAQANSCDYCLAAHSAIGKKAGLSEDDLRTSRLGEASDPKLAAILNLSSTLVQEKGQINDAGLQAARDAGLSDGEIVEVVGNVVQNIFTNYINHVADTEIDFPKAATI